jgi:hypothetical protein
VKREVPVGLVEREEQATAVERVVSEAKRGEGKRSVVASRSVVIARLLCAANAVTANTHSIKTNALKGKYITVYEDFLYY